jgi:hypothetical protein
VAREPDLGLRIVADDWLVRDAPGPIGLPVSSLAARAAGDPPDLSSYAGSLPDASGEFTGTFGSAAADPFLPPPGTLFPVDIDTGNGAVPPMAPDGSVLTITIGNDVFEFGVGHTEITGLGRVRIWCRPPGRVISGG